MFILNTRPKDQAVLLTRCLQDKKHTVIELPLMKIEPVAIEKKRYSAAYAIFLSANAVTHFYTQASLQVEKIIAIGPATQAALRVQGVADVLCPAVYSSEGLLAMPILKESNNQKILIISGEQPKPLLSSVLQARGATVAPIACYRRVRIPYEKNRLFSTVISQNVTHIVVTSGENLQVLVSLFEAFCEYQPWLYQKTLCVINEEMKNAALKAGFQSVIQAKNATDRAIIEALQEVT